MQRERISERTSRFYFNTGVRPERVEAFPYDYHREKGHVIRGTLLIPFDADDVPERAEFVCCTSNIEQYKDMFIIAEIRNTSMVSKYAVFKKPINYEAEVLADSYVAACEATSKCRASRGAESCDKCGKYNSKKLCDIRGRAESLFTVLQRINPGNGPLPF